MKKKILVTLMTAVLIAPSFCFARVSDDKAAHIGASAAVGLVLAQNKPFCKWKPWQRALFNVAIIGGAKEWYDHNHPGRHSAEWGDIAADTVGAIGAEGCVWLIHKSF